MTRPSRVDVESTSEPVAEINSVGVTIAVRNSMVELSAFGFMFTRSPAAIPEVYRVDTISLSLKR